VKDNHDDTVATAAADKAEKKDTKNAVVVTGDQFVRACAFSGLSLLLFLINIEPFSAPFSSFLHPIVCLSLSLSSCEQPDIN